MLNDKPAQLRPPNAVKKHSLRGVFGRSVFKKIKWLVSLFLWLEKLWKFSEPLRNFISDWLP